MKIVKLGEVVTIDRSIVEPEAIKDGTLYVGLENITSEGRFSEVGETQNGVLNSAKFAFDASHVLYGKLRPYLNKVAVPDFRGVCSTDILPLRPTPGLDRLYLLHFLRQPRIAELATARSTGANLPRISPAQLLEFEIPLPPLPEQRRIAAALDKVDELRQKRRRAIQRLEELQRSVFLEMFGDPVSNPKGWPTVFLADVTEISGGLQLTPKRRGYPVEVPYLRVANVQRDKIDITELKTLKVTLQELKRCSLQREDILVVEGHGNIGEVGRSAIWYGSNVDMVH